MALKIRRGTEAERAALTGANPAAGEPIFVTDTGKLWVGDGVTTGGIEINPNINLNDLEDVSVAAPASGQVLTWSTPNSRWEATTLSIAQELNDLTNVDAITGVATKKVLKYDGTANGGAGGWVAGDEAFLSFDLDQQLASKSIDNLGDVSVSGTDSPTIGQVLAWDNVSSLWKPSDIDLSSLSLGNLETDITGSVFADDSSVMIDGVAGTVNLYNGVTRIVDNQISVEGVNEVQIGNINDSVSNVLQVINADGSEPIEIINIAGTGINDSAKFTFTGRHGDMVTPVKATAGDYVGVLSSRSVDPDVDGLGNEGNVPNSIIAMTVDNNETVANDTAKGKIIFLNNAGTGTTPSLVAASFDARGYFAINQATVHVADAHLDVNGFMKLAPQTAEPTAVEGMIVIADGTTWDPASKGGAVSYPVYYDGSAWNAFY